MVNSAFGKDLRYEDIYQHVTCPEKVVLVRQEGKILAMGSYNKQVLSGIPGLIVEGVTVNPEVQGKDIFRYMTDTVMNGEAIVCLRTQSPRMYRALEKYCSNVYPGFSDVPEAIVSVRKSLASHLGCEIDHKGIVKGFYGGLFYGKEPKHEKISGLFDYFGVNINDGDALLVVGVK